MRYFAAAFLLLLLAMPVYALLPAEPGGPPNPVTQPQVPGGPITGPGGAPIPQPRTDIVDIFSVLNKIVYWIFIILIIVAVIFILMAAFTYLTAGGDQAKIGKAHNSLIYAAVAIAVGIVSYSVPKIVEALLK